MAIDYVRGVFSRHTLSPNRVKAAIFEDLNYHARQSKCLEVKINDDTCGFDSVVTVVDSIV